MCQKRAWDPFKGNLEKTESVLYFSKKLSLTVKLLVNWRVKEWCHWLKGATHPFIIFTDHKNIEYLKPEKCIINLVISSSH